MAASGFCTACCAHHNANAEQVAQLVERLRHAYKQFSGIECDVVLLALPIGAGPQFVADLQATNEEV